MSSDFNPQFKMLGEILVHASKITEEQLNSALAEQKQTNEKIGQVLVSMGTIVEDDFIDRDITATDYVYEIIKSFRETSKKEFILNFDQLLMHYMLFSFYLRNLFFHF